jgi:cellulose biosynthesis protein BcsQ
MIITISSWKGGTGKTTLNTLLACTLARRGKKVLAIDLDSNLALGQVFHMGLKNKTSKDFLEGNGEGFSLNNGLYRGLEGIEPDAGFVDIMPSHLKSNLINNLMDSKLKINLRRSGLIPQYDYILIDPPGYWGSMARAAVIACDTLVVPGTPSRIDFEATKLYFNELQSCCIEANTLVAVNMFNSRLNLTGIYDEYQKEFNGFLMKESVPFIPSLKKLCADPAYKFTPNVAARLDAFVDEVISVSEGEENEVAA